MPCIKGSFPFWFNCNLLWFITRNQLIYTTVQTEENLESTKQQAKQYFFKNPCKLKSFCVKLGA